MTIQMIIDGGADLPDSMIEQHQLKVVPLNIHFGEEQYKTGITMDLPAFYKKLNRTDVWPTSSSPSPQDFYEKYKEVHPSVPILVLALTQGLSSTYNSAVIGRNMLLEEEPDRPIAVLNTKTASCGIALLVDEAARQIERGAEFSHIVAHMEKKIEQTTTLFVLKTLENVIRGGRLDRVKGTIAKTLNIKLLMKATDDEGSIEVTEKVRGNKKAIRRFIEQIGEYTHQFEDKVIALSHSNDEAYGQKVLKSIKEKYPFKDSIFTETGPLISTYAGESGLVIAFFRDDS
ncbi:DegV family protein [Halobacillus sp. Marseille-Q1614]|uniref:DegV family protein n=1 Tax=Halobacillus sp. Marseille-Q1614 TaxID=2709134 RepID=UPI00156E1672|nr:DegV family protein [Halobacillus sp. Marseille-Q1614]